MVTECMLPSFNHVSFHDGQKGLSCASTVDSKGVLILCVILLVKMSVQQMVGENARNARVTTSTGVRYYVC